MRTTKAIAPCAYCGTEALMTRDHVVPQAELIDFCKGIAAKIMKNSPVAIAKAIKAINANYEPINGGVAVIAQNTMTGHIIAAGSINR